MFVPHNFAGTVHFPQFLDFWTQDVKFTFHWHVLMRSRLFSHLATLKCSGSVLTCNLNKSTHMLACETHFFFKTLRTFGVKWLINRSFTLLYFCNYFNQEHYDFVYRVCVRSLTCTSAGATTEERCSDPTGDDADQQRAAVVGEQAIYCNLDDWAKISVLPSLPNILWTTDSLR